MVIARTMRHVQVEDSPLSAADVNAEAEDESSSFLSWSSSSDDNNSTTLPGSGGTARLDGPWALKP